MKKTRVVIRREKASGELILFFKNANSIDNWIEGFTLSGGHFEVSLEFLQKKCKAVDPEDPRAIKFAKLWESIGPERTKYHIAHRL